MLFSLSVFSQPTNEYTDPILAGFYPDPSICKTGDNYYLVTSTFAYFPGLPIFHSKDLVNWQQIGSAMDRPEQLDLEGAGVSRGLFAPTIRFYKGLYYIVCTLIDKGGNFIITAKDPAGPWSNPTWIKEIDGIDPSIFFDDNNKGYIVYNSIPPNNKSLYDGHRTIRIREFNFSDMKPVGEEKLLINGGTDISKKPVWIEAPHILKKDDYYYLICAEGGTGDNHSEVVFRSENILGPYISFEKNPILTQRDLDPKRKDPITTTGHADLIQTNDGKWYAFFLGCRPYEGSYYNTGRETFLTPVEWKDGWPIINPGFKEVQYHYPFPSQTKKYIPKYTSDFLFRDNFKNNKLAPEWEFLRTPKSNWYSLSKQDGLSMQLLQQTCSGKSNPAFLGHRQQHLKGYASTSLNFSATSSNEKAGMLIFQNEDHFYFLCKSVEDNKPVVQLYRSVADSIGKLELVASQKISSDQKLNLKIEANGNTYSFYFSENGKWQLLKQNLDAKFLSTKIAGGFVGSMYALYATSNGKVSEAKVNFSWFECKGND